jgi:hypothetical protein
LTHGDIDEESLDGGHGRAGARSQRFRASGHCCSDVAFTAKLIPVEGFPHTGNLARAGAALKLEYTIPGAEYGAIRCR